MGNTLNRNRIMSAFRAGCWACVAAVLVAGCGPRQPADEGAADPAAASGGPDLERGERLALACAACHTFGAGEPHNVGPNLHGVFGRPAATAPGFDYSDALESSGLVWTPEALERWLADPLGFVPGTTMAFTGYQKPADRADLIAYLQQVTASE
ncbi:MAG TPA: cytochrome c family protein [Gammaproteobacteria bacterium]